MSTPWPLWRALIQEGHINSLERAFAESWGAVEPNSFRFCPEEGPPPLGESCALLLVYLLKASLEGHLCVQWGGELAFSPHLPGWNLTTDSRWRSTLENWRRALLEGDEQIPIASKHQIFAPQSPPVIKRGKRIYLQRQFLLEEGLCESLRSLQSESAEFAIPLGHVAGELASLTRSATLLPEQAQAISTCCGTARLTCLVGGPGTGKTFTAGHLISLLARCCKGANLRIALTAPTGRAAANLQRVLRAVGNLPEGMQVSAETLHALLGIFRSPDRALSHRMHPLIHDIILVDESSMIDSRLMSALLRAIKPGARLILMGDRDQLPPVELGSPFADYLSYLIQRQPSRVTILKQCKRAEIQPIVDLAASVRAGDFNGALASLSHCEGVSWSSLESPEDWRAARRAILTRACQLSGAESVGAALKLFDRCKILSPLKVGPWGVERLNDEVYHSKRAQAAGGEQLPLLITSNDRDLQLFNGDLGVLTLTQEGQTGPIQGRGQSAPAQCQQATTAQRQQGAVPWRERGATAHFASSDGLQAVPAALLPDCELAWALSIHKAQGSEFEEIDLIIPPDCERISRQLLYTALTRARRSIRIWSAPGDLKRAIQLSQERLSGLVDQLIAAESEELES